MAIDVNECVAKVTYHGTNKDINEIYQEECDKAFVNIKERVTEYFVTHVKVGNVVTQ